MKIAIRVNVISSYFILLFGILFFNNKYRKIEKWKQNKKEIMGHREKKENGNNEMK